MRSIYLPAVALLLAAAPALAEEDWSARILKGCTSVEKENCFLKPETRICAPTGGKCRYIGIDNYVAVRRLMGRRILVDTAAGPAIAPLSGLVTTGD